MNNNKLKWEIKFYIRAPFFRRNKTVWLLSIFCIVDFFSSSGVCLNVKFLVLPGSSPMAILLLYWAIFVKQSSNEQHTHTQQFLSTIESIETNRHAIHVAKNTVNTRNYVANTYMWYENAWLVCTKWYTRMICTTNDAESKWSLILWKNDFLQMYRKMGKERKTRRERERKRNKKKN